MSVCRKLPDGTVQKIAGHTILLDANASEVRQGRFHLVSTTAEWVQQNITFTDPMPDNDYVVIIENDKETYSAPPGPYRITNKTTTGFTLASYNEGDASGHVNMDMTGTYTAFKPVKIEGYTALQNKVNSPDGTPTINSMNLVTSDGVARAIENASAVWKGTKAEWNALPAADKKKYDLAVLLDQTLVKAVDREDGTETDVANLNKIFRGTEAEWQALSAAEKDEYDEAVTTGEQNPVAWPFPHPDWANAVAITIAQVVAGYTVPGDGMIVGYGLSTHATYRDLSVNNVVVSRTGFWYNAWSAFSNIQAPVSKGDIFKSTGALEEANFHFVPWKQA